MSSRAPDMAASRAWAASQMACRITARAGSRAAAEPSAGCGSRIDPYARARPPADGTTPPVCRQARAPAEARQAVSHGSQDLHEIAQFEGSAIVSGSMQTVLEEPMGHAGPSLWHRVQYIQAGRATTASDFLEPRAGPYRSSKRRRPRHRGAGEAHRPCARVRAGRSRGARREDRQRATHTNSLSRQPVSTSSWRWLSKRPAAIFI